MRTIIDIPDNHAAALADISATTGLSRNALIRDAVNLLLEQRRKTSAAMEDCFGLWKNRTDGIAYQRKIRSEW